MAGRIFPQFRTSRRRLFLGSSALLAAASAHAQDSRRPAIGRGNSLRDIVQSGTLNVAVPNFDSPPFFHMDGNSLSGLDPEIARGVANSLQVGLNFIRTATSFNEAVDQVARGDADLALCKLSRTLRRGQFITYSRPYAQLNQGLIVNRIRFAGLAHGRRTEDVIRDFDGNLGVIENSSFAEFAEANFPKAHIQTYGTWESMVNAIRNGTIDAAYRDEFEIKKLLIDDPSLAVVAQSVTLTDQTDTLAIGISADAVHLASFVNLYLDLSHIDTPMTADGILARYYKKERS